MLAQKRALAAKNLPARPGSAMAHISPVRTTSGSSSQPAASAKPAGTRTLANRPSLSMPEACRWLPCGPREDGQRWPLARRQPVLTRPAINQRPWRSTARKASSPRRLRQSPGRPHQENRAATPSRPRHARKRVQCRIAGGTRGVQDPLASRKPVRDAEAVPNHHPIVQPRKVQPRKVQRGHDAGCAKDGQPQGVIATGTSTPEDARGDAIAANRPCVARDGPADPPARDALSHAQSIRGPVHRR